MSDLPDAETATLYLIRNSKTGEWFMGSIGGDDGIWAKNIALSVVYSSQTGPRSGLPEDGEWVEFAAASGPWAEHLDAARAEADELFQRLHGSRAELAAALARNAELQAENAAIRDGRWARKMEDERDAARAELDNLRDRLTALGTKWEDLAHAPIDKGPGFSVRPHYAYFADQLRAAIVRGSDDE